MFWTTFGYLKRIDLVPLNGDPKSEKGGVIARVYQAINC